MQWRIQDFYTIGRTPMEIFYKLGTPGQAGKSRATILYRKSNKLSFIFTNKRKVQPRVSVDFYQTSPKSSRRSQERMRKCSLSQLVLVSFLWRIIHEKPIVLHWFHTKIFDFNIILWIRTKLKSVFREVKTFCRLINKLKLCLTIFWRRKRLRI